MLKAEVFTSKWIQRPLNASRRARNCILWALGGVMLFAASAEETSAPPDWWQSRGVIKAGGGAMDYAPANQGQLKNFARAARDEMLAKHVIAAGHPIDVMVQSWTTDVSEARDYSPLNLGQLKAVSLPFYDRFIEVGLRDAGSYPWAGSARPASDYAAANIGQLKTVFNFSIAAADPNDINFNGIPDAWEIQMFGGLNQGAAGDLDGDGVNNYDEWLAGTNPNTKDSKAVNLKVYILILP